MFWLLRGGNAQNGYQTWNLDVEISFVQDVTDRTYLQIDSLVMNGKTYTDIGSFLLLSPDSANSITEVTLIEKHTSGAGINFYTKIDISDILEDGAEIEELFIPGYFTTYSMGNRMVEFFRLISIPLQMQIFIT